VLKFAKGKNNEKKQIEDSKVEVDPYSERRSKLRAFIRDVLDPVDVDNATPDKDRSKADIYAATHGDALGRYSG
jgi:hypothetical protein